MSIASSILALLVLAHQTPPASPPATPAPAPQSSPAPATVDEILAALEKAGEGLKDFQGNIVYESYDAFSEETQRRYGSLVLDGVGPSRRFAFVFDRLETMTRDPDGTERVDPDESRDHWVYADGWLTEINSKQKSVIKRQIAEEGKPIDPLKLGEGPFPLPIGQARAAVLEQFDATTCELPALPLFKSVKDVNGLKLVPKPGTRMAEDYVEVQLFYVRADTALRCMHLKEKNGNSITVLLAKPKLNGGLSAEQRALLEQPDLSKPEWDPKVWAVDVHRLGAAPPAPAPGQSPPAAKPAAPATGVDPTKK
ncbi:MAG: hypothetical protein U0572_07140 [Phycisphaerales bacterium]